MIDGRKPKFREFVGDADEGDALNRVLFSHDRMLHENPVLTAEKLDTLVAYLMNSKNSVDDGCALIGVKWEDIDNASMFEFDMRIFQCTYCLAWRDLPSLAYDDAGAICACCDATLGTLDDIEAFEIED